MDTSSLVMAAESSGLGEYYRAVCSSDEYKIGISAVRQPSGNYGLFMEIVINLCCRGRQMDMEKLDRHVKVLRSLSEAGYDISCDGGEFACEKEVPPECLDDELALIMILMGIGVDLPTP